MVISGYGLANTFNATVPAISVSGSLNVRYVTRPRPQIRSSKILKTRLNTPHSSVPVLAILGYGSHVPILDIGISTSLTTLLGTPVTTSFGVPRIFISVTYALPFFSPKHKSSRSVSSTRKVRASDAK